jgi:UDP-N-acetylglucosamine--N-acetylmuramyl-(pentapeptide) pyrophosphoryl-undecaprenol N-acetylglucosamine transferase
LPALHDIRVLVAAGGTGGHLTPALAVADELAARGALVTFVTTPSQVERVGARYPAYALEMRGFERHLLARANAVTLRRLAAAAPRAWRIVSEVKPRVAVGGGGYLSGPVVALAAVRGVPSLAIEADAHLGVTNWLLSPLVSRVCLSFPIRGHKPPRYVVTGRPLSAAQLDADAPAGRAAFGLSADEPVVLVFGGSQGAQTLNRACLDAFGSGPLDLQLLHVCGPCNFDDTAAVLAARGADVEHYHLLPYTDELAHAMAVADLVVGRAGGSVAEIAALGRPAVLVPYPHATADHQTKNAAWMAAAGAAVVVADAELDGPRLGGLVRELLADRERLAHMAAASRTAGRPDATQRVADEIEDLLDERVQEQRTWS